jgi:hypothetical protein
MSSQQDPIHQAAAITPHDSNTIDEARALYVGGAGDVILTVNGTDITFTGMLAGNIYPIYYTAVKATGTSATNLVALY